MYLSTTFPYQKYHGWTMVKQYGQPWRLTKFNNHGRPWSTMVDHTVLPWSNHGRPICGRIKMAALLLRYGGCVYVLQVFFFCFFVLFCFFCFSVHHTTKYQTTVLGKAERIFTKLLPNDSGENVVCNVVPKWGPARPPNTKITANTR